MALPEQASSPVNEELAQQVEALTRQLFGEDINLDEPIPGMTGDDIIAANVHDMIRDPGNTLVELLEDDQVIGFSLAVPIGKMDPAREAESAETAYIYFTGVEPSRQGQRLAASVNSAMEEKLRTKGYRFMERDCMVADGYADKVEKAYKPAIVEQYDHDRWDYGPQRFFKIELSRIVHD